MRFDFEEMKMSTDYKDRCGNCHSHMDKADKYCRYCGTPRGEGAFEPYSNEMLCLYGPPITTKFKCKTCGHAWTTSTLGGDRSKFCPVCGGDLAGEELILI